MTQEETPGALASTRNLMMVDCEERLSPIIDVSVPTTFALNATIGALQTSSHPGATIPERCSGDNIFRVLEHAWLGYLLRVLGFVVPTSRWLLCCSRCSMAAVVLLTAAHSAAAVLERVRAQSSLESTSTTIIGNVIMLAVYISTVRWYQVNLRRIVARITWGAGTRDDVILQRWRSWCAWACAVWVCGFILLTCVRTIATVNQYGTTSSQTYPSTDSHTLSLVRTLLECCLALPWAGCNVVWAMTCQLLVCAATSVETQFLKAPDCVRPEDLPSAQQPDACDGSEVTTWVSTSPYAASPEQSSVSARSPMGVTVVPAPLANLYVRQRDLTSPSPLVRCAERHVGPRTRAKQASSRRRLSTSTSSAQLLQARQLSPPLLEHRAYILDTPIAGTQNGLAMESAIASLRNLRAALHHTCQTLQLTFGTAMVVCSSWIFTAVFMAMQTADITLVADAALAATIVVVQMYFAARVSTACSNVLAKAFISTEPAIIQAIDDNSAILSLLVCTSAKSDTFHVFGIPITVSTLTKITSVCVSALWIAARFAS